MVRSAEPRIVEALNAMSIPTSLATGGTIWKREMR